MLWLTQCALQPTWCALQWTWCVLWPTWCPLQPTLCAFWPTPCALPWSKLYPSWCIAVNTVCFLTGTMCFAFNPLYFTTNKVCFVANMLCFLTNTACFKNLEFSRVGLSNPTNPLNWPKILGSVFYCSKIIFWQFWAVLEKFIFHPIKCQNQPKHIVMACVHLVLFPLSKCQFVTQQFYLYLRHGFCSESGMLRGIGWKISKIDTEWYLSHFSNIQPTNKPENFFGLKWKVWLK